MFKTLVAFWTDPLVQAIDPGARSVFVFVAAAFALGGFLVVLSVIRKDRVLFPAGSAICVAMLFIMASGVSVMVRDARLLRSALSGSEIEVVVPEQGRVTLKRLAVVNDSDFVGRTVKVTVPEIEVTVFRDALSRIEEVLMKESADQASFLRAALQRSGIDDAIEGSASPSAIS